MPRVLIVGQTFTTDTGGGITLSNLFRNWPKERLAVAVDSKEALDFSRCGNYYRIGFTELEMPFPFWLLQRKTRSGKVEEDFAAGALHVKQTPRLKERLKNLFDSLFNHLGIFYWMYGNQQLSREFLHWVKDFNPELIYYQPNSYKSLKFVAALKQAIDIPLICHVMDDWFSYAIKPGPFAFLWKRRLDSRIKQVFALAELHLSICQHMSDEYLRRYGYRFYPFHNCVDLEFWSSGHKTSRNGRERFHILYAGRVGPGVEDILGRIAATVERMGRKGANLWLEIQTRDDRSGLVRRLLTYTHVRVSKPLAYGQLPEKFAEADLLLIPCDFRGSGIRFIKYSMPTKVSEYMATGTPILVIGPAGTALVNYARQGWAHVCESDEPKAIQEAIERLMYSEEAAVRLSERARNVVSANHEENRVRMLFRQKLLGLTALVQ